MVNKERSYQGHDIAYWENGRTYCSVGPLAVAACPANGGLEAR